MEVGNNDEYQEIGSWNGGDGVWHHNTIDLDKEHLNKKTTVRITTAFCLFGCGDTAKGRTVAVDNVLIQGTGPEEAPAEEPEEEEPADTENRPDLTANITVTPDSVTEGTSVSIRYAARNIGTVRTGRESITVYRHVSETDDPTTGGWQISTFTMRSPLAPGAEFSQETDTETPPVSEDTPVYYYACASIAENETQTDNNCSDPAVVTVTEKTEETPAPVEVEETPVETPAPVETPVEEPADTVSQIVVTPTDDYTEDSYPEPPYESCYDSPERKHVMAGDAALPRPITGTILSTTGIYSCGTITLGGVETKDGTKGFVASGHVLSGVLYRINGFTNTNILVGHSISHSEHVGPVYTVYIERLLGKVLKRSNLRDEGDEFYDKNVLTADAAFVAYPRPKTARCSLTWESDGETFCLDLGDNQIERVVPLKIRGRGRGVYTVVGSQEPEVGLALHLTGAVTGANSISRMTTDRKILYRFPGTGNVYKYSHIVPAPETVTIIGDSGSPVYTAPDANGNVRIVGIHGGRMVIDDMWHTFFTSWSDAAKALDLKPLSQ